MLEVVGWAVAIAIVVLAISVSAAILIKAIKSSPVVRNVPPPVDDELVTVQSLNADLNRLRSERFGRSMWTTTTTKKVPQKR